MTGGDISYEGWPGGGSAITNAAGDGGGGC